MLTDSQVVAAFGDPAEYVHGDGTVDRAWEDAILGMVHLPAPLPLAWNPAVSVTRFRCHKLVAARVRAALELIYLRPEAWASLTDFGGCYCWRPRRGNPAELSRHSWGIALDFDAAHRGVNIHLDVIQTFEQQGFEWGGYWHEPDPMHFECADARAGIVA